MTEPPDPRFPPGTRFVKVLVLSLLAFVLLEWAAYAYVEKTMIDSGSPVPTAAQMQVILHEDRLLYVSAADKTLHARLERSLIWSVAILLGVGAAAHYFTSGKVGE